MDLGTEERSVEVRFITKLDQYRVTETPFRLPTKLARFGLSGVINHLLSLDPPKPFDFLINNEFLRSSIEEYLQTKGISPENRIEIEYIEALAAPEPKNEHKHDDWISALDTRIQGLYLTGSYDGVARMWNSEGNSVGTTLAHTKPIKALRVFATDDTNVIRFVTGSQDQLVKVWTFNLKSGTSSNEVTARGHTNSVQAVDVSPDSPNKFCSGGWDNTIYVWNTDNATVPSEDDTSTVKGNSKKRKIVKSPEIKPLFTFQGHSQSISSIRWIEPTEILSASLDNNLQLWDLIALNSKTGSRGIIDMDFSTRMRLAATGHDDNAVRIWDFRADVKLVTNTLKSHVGWVSSVKWHTQNDYLLVTGSYDRSIKLWDIRSSVPLHTMTGHTDKVLAVSWDGDRIVSGGADTKLKTWDFATPLPK